MAEKYRYGWLEDMIVFQSPSQTSKLLELQMVRHNTEEIDPSKRSTYLTIVPSGKNVFELTIWHPFSIAQGFFIFLTTLYKHH